MYGTELAPLVVSGKSLAGASNRCETTCTAVGGRLKWELQLKANFGFEAADSAFTN
jgi:hypothetical protein